MLAAVCVTFVGLASLTGVVVQEAQAQPADNAPPPAQPADNALPPAQPADNAPPPAQPADNAPAQPPQTRPAAPAPQTGPTAPAPVLPTNRPPPSNQPGLPAGHPPIPPGAPNVGPVRSDDARPTPPRTTGGSAQRSAASGGEEHDTEETEQKNEGIPGFWWLAGVALTVLAGAIMLAVARTRMATAPYTQDPSTLPDAELRRRLVALQTNDPETTELSETERQAIRDSLLDELAERAAEDKSPTG